MALVTDNISIYKYSYKEFGLGVLRYYLFVTLGLIISIWWGNHSYRTNYNFCELYLYFQISFILIVLLTPFIIILKYEMPKYSLIRNITIVYLKNKFLMEYHCNDYDCKFTFEDIKLFEIYRTIKDEGYIGYVINLKNGTRLRFTNRLKGVVELQRDIEAYGVKVENKTWFDMKKLPENIYV